MLPPGFEPGITALRGQYAWPDYTTGACKNENQLQFKRIGMMPNKTHSLIKIYLDFRLIDNFSKVCHLHH